MALHAGRVAEALRLSGEGREILRSIPDALASITVTGGIPREHLRLGDGRAAELELRAGREQASATGMRGFALSSLNEAEAESAVLRLAARRTRENARGAGSVIRRPLRHAGACRWHSVHAQAMDGCR